MCDSLTAKRRQHTERPRGRNMSCRPGSTRWVCSYGLIGRRPSFVRLQNADAGDTRSRFFVVTTSRAKPRLIGRSSLDFADWQV